MAGLFKTRTRFLVPSAGGCHGLAQWQGSWAFGFLRDGGRLLSYGVGMDVDSLHRAACERAELSYTDPQSGYRVFTALALERRGACCGCGCRHCPYGHADVSPERRASLRRDPWFEGPWPHAPADLLFWSGGKDSYLALRALQKEAVRPVVLLTTFDGRSEKVAHQEVRLEQIVQQGQALGLGQLLVPLYPEIPYMDRLVTGIQSFERRGEVARLVFGDLHLEHVRSWREEALAGCSRLAKLPRYFPLWQIPYAQLLTDLEAAPGRVWLSAVADEACARVVKVGDAFGSELIAQLPRGVDAFGENGEFHSYVEFPPGRVNSGA